MSAAAASEPGVPMLIAAKWWAANGHLVFPLHNPVPTAAKWWASNGHLVFPLHNPVATAEGLACSCGQPCGSEAKHPRTPNGLKDATSDLEQVTAWWTRWPNANIGIRTGVTFDLLDIDGEAGRGSMAAIVADIGEPLSIAVVSSGREGGGTHHYVEPAGLKALAGGKTAPPGIDVKGEGGYVVAPPSKHISGRRYAWQSPIGTITGTVPWPDFHAALRDRAPAKPAPPPLQQPDPFATAGPAGDRAARYGQAILTRVLDEARAEPPGSRWTQIATSHMPTLARAVAAGHLDASCITQLQEAARDAGLEEGEVRRLRSEFDAFLPKVHTPVQPKGTAPEPVPLPEKEAHDTPWDDPVPLDIEVPPFPTWTLGWLEADVLALAEQMQVPVDLPAMLTLATMAAATRGRFAIEIGDGWIEPLNLYIAVIAAAGETKSPVLAKITEELRLMEKEAQEEARPRIAEMKNRRRIQEGRIKRLELEAVKAVGTHERDLAEQAVHRAVEELEVLEVPALPRFLAGDMTAEALILLLSEQGGALASLSAEGGLFGTIAGGRYSGGLANLDGILQAHDGREPIMVDRKGGEPIRVERPCLTLGLAVQPQVVFEAGCSEAAVGRGLMARFLFSHPRSLVGLRDMGRDRARGDFAGFAGAIRGIDALARGGFAGFAGTSLKVILKTSSSSRYLHRAYLSDLEPRRHPTRGDLGDITSWANKLDGQIARIAGLLALLDAVDPALGNVPAKPAKPWGESGETGQDVPEVGDLAVIKACEIADYLIGHALSAHALMAGGVGGLRSPARILLEWASRRPGGAFTARDAHDALRHRKGLNKATEVKEVAAELCLNGHLRAVAHPPGTPGRPTQRYLVHPDHRA